MRVECCRIEGIFMDMDPIRRKAKIELLQVEQELAEVQKQAMALHTKRSELRTFITVYDRLHGPAPAEEAPEPPFPPGSVKERVITAVAELLKEGQPRTAKQLIAELAKMHIQIG